MTEEPSQQQENVQVNLEKDTQVQETQQEEQQQHEEQQQIAQQKQPEQPSNDQPPNEQISQEQTSQEQPPQGQNFVPRVGFLQPPRHRYPMPSNSYPPANGGGPSGGFPPQMHPPHPNFRPQMHPNYQMPPGSHGGEPPFFNGHGPRCGPPQNMGPPNMGPGSGGPPRPLMGVGRPQFPPGGGYPGGPMPPGFRPPMGMQQMPYGMRPQMHPSQNGHQQNGQDSSPQQSQQSANQTEKLKKMLGISAEKELWIETKTSEGKSYFYHSDTRQTVWERPEAPAVVMQQDEIQRMVEQSQREEKEQQQQMQHHGGGGPHGGMPPFMMPPGFPGGPGNPNDAWQEFTSPDGKKYYFNFITKENTWTKPKALIDKEAAARENGGVPPHMSGFPGGVPMMGGGAAMSPIGVGYAGFRPSTGTGGPQATLSNPQAGKKDKSRPVTSNAVAGTPWCVVWTGDNRVFFFNPSTRTSVWERPPELYNRPDVDLLVSKPPPAKEQLSNRAQKRLQKEESEEEEVDEEDEVEVHDSDSSNSDEEQQQKALTNPPKKKSRRDKKVEEELKLQLDNPKQPKLAVPVQQEKPIDPAIQAELEAQREREKVPLEERIKQFRQLLEDKKVSATSTWEKELSKIVFDQRYLLLSAVERKAAFDAYCRERAEIEKEEKRKRAKEAKLEFLKLLEEAKLHGKSTFSSFSTNSKWSKDPRFKAVEKSRDREAFFKDFVEQLYKKEKEEKRKEREKAKESFVALLKEQEDLRRNSIWSVVKKKLDKDERYRNKNLDSETRQKLFDEHVKTCPEPTEEEEAEAKRLADEALELANAAKDKALSEQQENEERDRERRKNSSNNITNSSSSRRRDKEREKGEKIVEKTAEEKALEDRKRQVEEELGEHLKERNREHERHKLLEHEQNFKALLMDLIKTSDISWHDGRKILKKDSRYQNCEFLDKEAKERHFREHIRDLERKKRDVFFQLLDEHQHITFTTKWHNAKKIIFEDEKFSKLKMDERKLEHEYRDWMERRHRQALDDFETLLRETKIITYKSKQMITENELHLRDILAVLENDARYLVLKERPSERERILDEYLDLLDRKGPPPPPTRNEDPDRRRK